MENNPSASPPTQGAWIEIADAEPSIKEPNSRPLHRGRGLKSIFVDHSSDNCESPPTQGAWIEIKMQREKIQKLHMSPPTQGAWIEIKMAQ